MPLHTPFLRVPLACVAAMFWLTSALPAQDSDAYVIMEAASVRFKTMKSLCADFHQVLDVPLLGARREGLGRLCQQGPSLFSMRFQDPVGDLVVVDGTHAWVYTPSQDPKQALRTPISEVGRGLDLHSEFLDEPRARYLATLEGSETWEGRSLRRILLIPREPTSYREAVVWIDGENSLLRKVEIHEENGSTRLVTLRAIQVDLEVPEGTFSFTPPPGTQVISR